MNPLISDYFKHIGYNKTPTANLETLKELHLLHTLKIPFENLTPFLDREVTLKSEDIFEKMITNNRGGYCFEQNNLFLTVLKEIGFKAKGLGARVLWNQDENLITRRSHMLIELEIEGKCYIADVGFGGLTLTTPLLFEVDLEQKTTHEVFKISQVEQDFKLQVMIKGEWKTLYRFDRQEQFLADYEVVNYYLSHHPESIFKTTLIAATPTKDGRMALKNNKFTYHKLNGESETITLKSEKEIKDILVNKFKIQLPQNCDLGRVC